MESLSGLILIVCGLTAAGALALALRRAGRAAAPFAALLAGDLALVGLALRRPEEQGIFFWGGVALITALVIVPQALTGMTRTALRDGALGRALGLLRLRQALQPGVHGEELRALDALVKVRAGELAAEQALRPELLTRRLDHVVRLAVIEELIEARVAAGRHAEAVALLEGQGRPGALSASPRIAAAMLRSVARSGPPEDAARAEEILADPGFRTRPARYWQTAPASTALIAAIVLVQLAVQVVGGGGGDDGFWSVDPWALLRFGANARSATLHGEPWRLLTSVFLHGGLIHLAVNGYAIFGIGRLVEQLYGSVRLWLVFLFAGLSGSAASALLGKGVLSVGASGAIFGLLGAAVVVVLRLRGVLNERWRRQVTANLLLVIGLNLYLGYTLAFIDNWAHLGGLAGGLLTGLLLSPSPRTPSPRRSPLWLKLLAGLAVAAVLVSGVLAAVTSPARTLARPPWRNVERGGLRFEVPARWEALGKKGLGYRDSLVRALVEVESPEPVDRKEGPAKQLEARAATARAELEATREVSGVERLKALPVTPGGTSQAAFSLRLHNETFYAVMIYRVEGDVLLEAQLLFPVARLHDVAPMVRRFAESLRYQVR